jgi:ferredoxin
LITHGWTRYILWAAEEQGYELPFACRLGCCTACTVKIKEGQMYQPQSLGLSKSLREQVRHALSA